MPDRIQEPWLSFLRDLDQALKETVEVHCLGGFVLSVLWGLPRPTGDVDFIEVRPIAAGEALLRLAGEGAALAKKHDLCVRHVTVAEYPEGYEGRLIDITPEGFRRLKLRALEVHDVVLAKLSRNSPRDRADVEYLARKGVLDRRRLEERFEAELRPNLLNEKRGMLTLELWLAEFFGKTDPVSGERVEGDVSSVSPRTGEDRERCPKPRGSGRHNGGVDDGRDTLA